MAMRAFTPAAFIPTFSRYSVGKVLLAKVIDEAERDGAMMFDFCGATKVTRQNLAQSSPATATFSFGKRTTFAHERRRACIALRPASPFGSKLAPNGEATNDRWQMANDQ
jgi:hypothetical protein